MTASSAAWWLPKRRLAGAAGFVRDAYRAYTGDDCPQSAAAIAYYLLFSVVPLLILLASVFGFALANASVKSNVVDFVVQNAHLSEPDGRRQVQDALDSVQGAAGALTFIGLAGTAWAGSAVFVSTRKSLNRVWGVQEHRAFLKQKLVDFGQMGLLFLLLITSVVATGFLRALREVSTRASPFLVDQASPVWEIPNVLLPAAITFTAFALIYRYVPARRPSRRELIAGSAVATVLFEVLKDTFALYVAHFTRFQVLYGSLAAVFLFLLYTYLGASVLLLGAEVAKVVGIRRTSGSLPHPAAVRQPS